MNTSFLIGGLVGIAVTIAFECLVAFLFGLPRDGVDVDEPASESPSDVVDGHTGAVRLHVAREFPCDECIPGGFAEPVDNVTHIVRVDTPPDAGHVTVGQALGVVVVLAALVLLAGLVGAVETAGL